MRLLAVALAVLAAQLPPGSTSHPHEAADARASLTVVAQDEGSGMPLGDVTVTLSPAVQPKRVVEATTLPNGAVRFEGLAPGRYMIVSTAPDLVTPSAGSPFVTMDSVSTTVTVNPGENRVVPLTFTRACTITGQVLTEAGRPAKGSAVEIAVWRFIGGKPSIAPGPSTPTDADGSFALTRLPPGRYLVRARLPATDTASFNPVYAPGTTAAGEATAVELQGGDTVRLGITARLVPTVSVAGRVVDSGKHPVQNAAVRLLPLDESAGSLILKNGRVQSPAPVDAPNGVQTDADGRFVVRSVRQGRYALQAVVRGPERDAPVLAAGFSEVDVRTSPIDRLAVSLVPSARMTGRFLFNGLEVPDPGRTQISMQPTGADAQLRGGLATSTAWHADGTFEVEGLFGSHRLSIGFGAAWFIEDAVLENGTDLAGAPFSFEPGKVYNNARVAVSDVTAEIQGPIPAGWDEVPSSILAFPDDQSLWEQAAYVRQGTVSAETRRFSVRGLPPGHMYLVATVPSSERWFYPAPFRTPADLLDRLSPGAVRVFVGEPATIQVTLPARRR